MIIMTMKRFFYAGLALLMWGGLAFSFTACSDDDDDENSSGVINSEVGLRLVSVDRYKYTYYDDGRLETIYYRDEPFRFTYKPDRIWIGEENEERDPEDGPAYADASYTSQGYLKSLSYSDEHYKISAIFTYDSDGHLTKISVSYAGPEESYRSAATLTWRTDLLRMIAWQTEEYDDEESYGESYKIVYDYDGEELIENPHLQFAASLIDFMCIGDGELERGLAHVGKLGKGPKYLPTGCQREWEEVEDGKVHTGTSAREFKYGFNIDNALSYVMINNERITYRYDFTGSRTLPPFSE